MSPEEQSYKLSQVRNIVIFGVAMGMLYVLIQDGTGNTFGFMTGAVVGLILGVFIGLFETYIAPRYINYRNFLTVITSKTLIYSLVIVMVYYNVLVVLRMARFSLSYLQVLESEEFQRHVTTTDFKVALVYIVVVAFFIIAIIRISKRFGLENLLEIILGTYKQPKVKYRIIMFMRIKSAPQIIDILGKVKFYKLLNDYYYDISNVILRHHARIYQYFNEEIVLYWDINKGLKNANIVRFYFGVLETLQWRKEYYLDNYGFLPNVAAGIHCGELVISEVGDIKTDIILSGDVINTTARVATESMTTGSGLLVSNVLFRQLNLPAIYSSVNHGPVQLRGKRQEIDLVEVKVADV